MEDVYIYEETKEVIEEVKDVVEEETSSCFKRIRKRLRNLLRKKKE